MSEIFLESERKRESSRHERRRVLEAEDSGDWISNRIESELRDIVHVNLFLCLSVYDVYAMRK